MIAENLRRYVLGPAAAIAVVLGLGGCTTHSSTILNVEHSVRSYFAEHGKAADLEVPDVPGLKMFLHPDDTVITYRIMVEKLWEPNETHWVSRFVREGDTFVDIGANVGYFTLVASRLVGDTGHVYAFEPDPVAFGILQRNVRLNGLRNVTLEQKAVSNEPGTLRLFLSEKNKGDHQIYESDEQRKSIDIEAVTLDDYFADYEGRIDFVKIDTQGAEAVILEGMDDVLRANDDVVMAVEFWPYGLSGLGSNAREYLELLRSYDFLFFDLGLGVGGKRPLKKVLKRDLLQRFAPDAKHSFTNLLVIRGYEQSHKLGWELLGRQRELSAAAALLTTARDEWERTLRDQIRRHGAESVALPLGMPFLLAKDAANRSAREQHVVGQYFRSVAPQLAKERAEVSVAKHALNSFQVRILESRMRDATR